MADIKFMVEVDSKRGQASIKELDKNVGTLEKTTKKTSSGFKGMWKQVAAGVLITQAITVGMRKLIGFMKDSIEKAGIQEQAEKDLEAALASTGREVDNLSEHFKNYASKLQSATVFGDEQVIQAQALLIQLTKLDKQGLDAATRGAIGLASVYKQDLNAATVLVGKALAGNYGALSRYGIMVKRTATDEEKRASILEQLAVMYQRAEAETDTYAGSMKQLNNVWGDLKETIGKTITENDAFRKGIKDLKDWVDKLAKSEDFKLWLSTVIDGLVKAAKFAGKLGKAIRDITFSLAGGKKANKEYIEAQKKLRAALERARKAGHDYRFETKEVHEETSKAVKITKNYAKTVNTVIKAGKGARVSIGRFRREVVSTNKILENAVDTLGQAKDKFVELAPPARDMTNVLNQAAEASANFASQTYVDVEGIANAWYEAYEGSIKPTYDLWGEDLIKVYGWVLDFKMNTEAAWQGMINNMVEGFMQWGESTGKILDEFKEIFGSFVDEVIAGMGRMLMQSALSAAREWVLKQTEALASVIASVMKAIPFPFNVAAVGGAIALVKALFSKIKAFEKGGIVYSPTLALIGEKGPEIITPLRKTTNVYNQMAQRPQVIHNHIYIGGQKVTESILNIVNKGLEKGKIKISQKNIVR